MAVSGAAGGREAMPRAEGEPHRHESGGRVEIGSWKRAPALQGVRVRDL